LLQGKAVDLTIDNTVGSDGEADEYSTEKK
jgi:hypothetical protein